MGIHAEIHTVCYTHTHINIALWMPRAVTTEKVKLK